MPKEDSMPDLSQAFEDREGQKTIKMRVDELEVTKNYQINEDCPVEEYSSKRKVSLEKGTNFHVVKKYDGYSHLQTDAGINFSLSNSQELPILKE